VVTGKGCHDLGPGGRPYPGRTQADAPIDANLGPLVQRVRAAAGPKTPIIGTTYPEVALYGFLLPLPIAENLARLSVTTFRDVINPALALAAEYRSGAGVLVDATRATGAYGSLDATTRLPPYGTIPVPVAKVCRLTFICRSTDIHPTTAGYRLIAVLIAKALPRRTS
jgi:lysophospholipase L1-like esterase